jgi:hypothetical protein
LADSKQARRDDKPSAIRITIVVKFGNMCTIEPIVVPENGEDGLFRQSNTAMQRVPTLNVAAGGSL